MGYDHFALLCLAHTPSDKEYKLLKKSMKNLKSFLKSFHDDDDPIFGCVHHLSSGIFTDYWWKLFDKSIEKIYSDTNIEKFHLYVCEFDGESVIRHEYVNGKRTQNEHNIEITINDPAITSYWSIQTLIIARNITPFYNKSYTFEYYDK